MRREPRVIEDIDSLEAAHQIMREHGVRHLPVLRAGKLVGVLSERDLLDFRANLGFADDWRRAAVSGAMTRSPQTAGPDDGLTEVAGRLAHSRIGCLPIVERGALLGLVTVSDVLAGEVSRAMAPAPSRRATASDVMTPGPFSCRPEESLLAVAKRMSGHGIRHLPVIDEDNIVLGMISERDLRTYVGDPARFATTHTETAMRVCDALKPPLVTVLPDHPLAELAVMFEDARIGAIPVVDDGGKLLGIVSYVDALRAFARLDAP